MTAKRIYWICTGALCGFMATAAVMYFLRYDYVSEEFTALGYPTYLVAILAVLKIAGVITLLANRPGWLVEWAYAGFFFDFSLALTAHLVAGDDDWIPAVVALVLLGGSRYLKEHRDSP